MFHKIEIPYFSLDAVSILTNVSLSDAQYLKNVPDVAYAKLGYRKRLILSRSVRNYKEKKIPMPNESAIQP